MKISVRMTLGPLDKQALLDVPGAGAILCFEGVVRAAEEGRVISALEYESYEPMTTRELSALAADVARHHEVLELHVEHSTGRVAVGEISFRLQIASCHRGPGLRAMDEFINRLKQHIPLWKVPIWSDTGSEHERV